MSADMNRRDPTDPNDPNDGGRPSHSGLVPVEAVMDARLRLEDLVDREGLGALTKSFFSLFGIPVRVYSNDGALLADASKEHEVCAYVNSLPAGRPACGATVGAVRTNDGGVHPCFTGNAYRIVPIEYDGRRMGRIILGPYLPTTVTAIPKTFGDVDRGVDSKRAFDLLQKVPRAKEETVTRIATHFKGALDMILFSGHKALLTSQMHLASVRESYRELSEKNTRLQEAYDKLKELDRLKSNFLATVSHELRTPLTSIIGYSEMLSEGIAGPIAGEQLEFVKTIHDKGEQLLGLITSLLDLSKLESGTLSVKKKDVHIKELLDGIVSTVTPVSRKKGLRVVATAPEGLPSLHADPERLRQVFTNLTDNAIKFTPQGGTITLSAKNLGASDNDEDDSGFALLAPVKNEIEVRVADSGIGIPPRERERVFDAFYQVDSSSTREYGGTGLGLSIVKRLVDAHGGSIHIEENVPQGTVFVVRLPSNGQG